MRNLQGPPKPKSCPPPPIQHHGSTNQSGEAGAPTQQQQERGSQYAGTHERRGLPLGAGLLARSRPTLSCAAVAVAMVSSAGIGRRLEFGWEAEEMGERSAVVYFRAGEGEGLGVRVHVLLCRYPRNGTGVSPQRTAILFQNRKLPTQQQSFLSD